MVPVVVTYSWGEAPVVFLCDDDDSAEKQLRKLWEEEKRIDTEENDWGDMMDAAISSDGRYAYISLVFEDETDVTKWHIGHIAPKID